MRKQGKNKKRARKALYSRFLKGDPMFLSGIGPKAEETGRQWQNGCLIADEDERITEEDPQVHRAHDTAALVDALQKAGQKVYAGLGSYGETVTPNKALTSYDGFSLGLELELIVHNGYIYNEILNLGRLVSNWFYCRRDGSLPKRGLELITIPLSEEIVRDPTTWQALCSALRDAFSSSYSVNTGLHFHVGWPYLMYKRGITQDACTIQLSTLYLEIKQLMGDDFYTNLFGRACTSYCSGLDRSSALDSVISLAKEYCAQIPKRYVRRLLSNPKLFSLTESCHFHTERQPSSLGPRDVSQTFSALRGPGEISIFRRSATGSPTIEFRRGKGTLSADQIFAQIEFIYFLCSFVRNNSITYYDAKVSATKCLADMANRTKSPLLKYYVCKYFPGVCIDAYGKEHTFVINNPLHHRPVMANIEVRL